MTAKSNVDRLQTIVIIHLIIHNVNKQTKIAVEEGTIHHDISTFMYEFTITYISQSIELLDRAKFSWFFPSKHDQHCIKSGFQRILTQQNPFLKAVQLHLTKSRLK